MARIPNAEGPTQKGCSKAAAPQISSGFRRSARIVDIRPRGLSERGGNGGMNSLCVRAATDIDKTLLRTFFAPPCMIVSPNPPGRWHGPDSEGRSLTQCGGERSVIKVVELSPDRHAMRKPGDFDRK